MRKLAAALGFCVVALAVRTEAAEDRLTPLLRFVPMEAVADGVHAPVIYSDLAAMRATGLASIPSLARSTWSPDDIELAGLSRVVGLPGILGDYVNYFGVHRFETTADYLGFAWADIETAIGYGMPPGTVTIVQGTPAVADAAAIGETLTGRGFAAEDRAGHHFWWRLEDYALDLRHREPADPLRGHLGGSARAGIVDGAFVAAAGWPNIDGVLAAIGGDRPTLAESGDFTAMAHALGRPVGSEGRLLQAHLMAGAFDAAFVVDTLLGSASQEEEIAEIRARLTEGGTEIRTPRYSAFGIGDRQEGERAIAVVALVYRDREEAERATQTVPAAVASLDSLATHLPFSELLPFEIGASVVESPDGSRHVAVITFTSTLPPLDAPAGYVPTAYSRLIQMLYRSDMGPFVAAGD